MSLIDSLTNEITSQEFGMNKKALLTLKRTASSIERYQIKEPNMVELVQLYAEKREASFSSYDTLVQSQEIELAEINRELESTPRKDQSQIVLTRDTLLEEEEKEVDLETPQALKHFELFEEEPESTSQLSSEEAFEIEKADEKKKPKKLRKKLKRRESIKEIREQVNEELKKWKKELDEIKNYKLIVE